MERIRRSFQLVAQSYRILMKDKELMVLPLISGGFMLAAVAAMALGFGVSTGHVPRRGPELYIPVFLFYVVTYTIGIFFQAAVIAGATERMRGGDPTVASALGAAGHRFWSIVMWAIVAATVGMVIRAIHDRVGFVGRLITSLFGVAWSLATFFASTSSGTLPPSTTVSLKAFTSNFGPSVAFALSRRRLISL